MKNEFVQTPILPDECPACHHAFTFVSRQVVQSSTDKTLVHGLCGECKSQLMLFQFGKDNTVLSAIALLTDLTYDDACAYWAAQQVTQNDVLQLHELLQDESVFLEKLLSRETN